MIESNFKEKFKTSTTANQMIDTLGVEFYKFMISESFTVSDEKTFEAKPKTYLPYVSIGQHQAFNTECVNILNVTRNKPNTEKDSCGYDAFIISH